MKSLKKQAGSKCPFCALQKRYDFYTCNEHNEESK